MDAGLLPDLPSCRRRLERLADAHDDALVSAWNEVVAMEDALEEALLAAGEAEDAALQDAIGHVLDFATEVEEELSVRHAAPMAAGEVRVRTDACTAHRGRVVRRSGAQARVLRRHARRPARSPRPRVRSRGAGRPAARRTSSGSRTASTDPGDPDPDPPARRARYAFACLTAEQRGETGGAR
jgi:hypothetical protein